MLSFSRLFNLRVTGGNASTPQHAKKMRKRINLAILIAFSCAIGLTAILFAARLCWHVLYTQNDRLTLKYIDFKDTAHYTAYPTHGHADFQTILDGLNVKLNATNLLAIDLDAIQNHLKINHPVLRNIAISKILPNTLKIVAEEYDPMAFLVTKNGQGGPMHYPIAIYKHQMEPLEAYSAILLSTRLELYDSRKNQLIPWNYALYSRPFDGKSINSILPLLFNFNATVSAAPGDVEHAMLYRKYATPGTSYPGQIVADTQLSSAIKFIELLGVSSPNKFFVIQQISYVPPNTLRVLVDPQPKGRKIQPSAQFDFEANAITDKLARNLLAFLANCEKDPHCRQIRYLSAADKTIFSSPEPLKLQPASTGKKNQVARRPNTTTTTKKKK